MVHISRKDDAIDMAHDAFVKRILGNPEHARDFLSLHLPAEVVAVLDLASLQTAKGSFVGKGLRQYFSDLVFHLDLLCQLGQSESRMEYIEIFLRYAISSADLDEEDLNEALKNIPRSMKEENMPTLAQKWLEQGWQKSQQEGWQKGRLETIRETILRLDSLGLDIEVICKAVALPKSEVEKVIGAQSAREGH